MAEQPIGLQELIAQVKRELLKPLPGDEAPVLYVEQVELELAVTVTREGQGGIKVYVLEAGAGVSRQQGQLVKVSLRPLYTVEELRSLAEKDAAEKQRMQETAQRAVMKGLFSE